MKFEAEYEEALIRWLKAHKDHPGIYHGPEPAPSEYGLTTNMETWEANQIRDRIYREMARTA